MILFWVPSIFWAVIAALALTFVGWTLTVRELSRTLATVDIVNHFLALVSAVGLFYFLETHVDLVASFLGLAADGSVGHSIGKR